MVAAALPAGVALAAGTRLIWRELGPLAHAARRAAAVSAAWQPGAGRGGLAVRWRLRLALVYGAAAAAWVAWGAALLLISSDSLRAALTDGLR